VINQPQTNIYIKH